MLSRKQWLATGCVVVLTLHITQGLPRSRSSSLWRAQVSIMDQIVQQLVTAASSEIEKENPPHREIREKGSNNVELVAKGGSSIRITFSLTYDHPEENDYIINSRLLKIIAPLTMTDLSLEFQDVLVTRASHVTYNGSLVIKFPRKMTLTMEILVNRHLTSCTRGVYFAEIERFDYEPVIVFPRYDPFRHAQDVKQRFLEDVRRMTDRYSFYILRNTFNNIGEAFGEDLCTIG